MVFANLEDEDKVAFFGLLDEYFSSRPELAEALQLASSSISGTATGHGHGVHSSTSNQTSARKSIPPRPSSSSSSTSAFTPSVSSPPPSSSPNPALRPPTVPRRVSATTAAQADDAAGKDRPKLARPSPSPSNNTNNSNSNQDLSHELSSAVGRIAAARIALENNTNNDPNPNSRPAPLPRRMASTSSDVSAASSDRPSRTSFLAPPGFPRKLQDASSKIDARPSWPWVKSNNTGDEEEEASPALVTPSSLKVSRLNSPANPTTPTPANSALAPPPRRAVPPRRVFSPPEPDLVPEPEPESEAEEEEEEAAQGEWAEVLYDYTSSDPNDLELKAEERVLVKEHTSDDWWTAELDGKTGLIPAAYVKLL